MSRAPASSPDDRLSSVKLDYLARFLVGPRVLDVGCGLGLYAKHLRDRGCVVTAVDLAPQVADERIAFCQVSGDNLPFKAEAFDTALMFDVLEHMPDDGKALDEARRVTRSRLILSVPSADDEVLYWYNLTFKHHIDKTHVREYSPAGLESLLAAHGFQVVHLRPEGPVSPYLVQEFIPGRLPRAALMVLLKAWWKLGFIDPRRFCADIFAVADKVPGEPR